MKKSIIVAIAALLIQGCGASCHATGFTGGHHEIQLDENVFDAAVMAAIQ